MDDTTTAPDQPRAPRRRGRRIVTFAASGLLLFGLGTGAGLVTATSVTSATTTTSQAIGGGTNGAPTGTRPSGAPAAG